MTVSGTINKSFLCFHNLVKFRNNDSPYNVFRFEKPVFASKVRVYVLSGHSAITEIELYGALPKEAQP